MGKMAYLFDFFPALSQTFLQREVNILEAQGMKILLVSWRSLKLAEIHPQDAHFLDRCFYLRPPRLLQWLKANARFMIEAPGRYFGSLKLAFKLGVPSPKKILRNLIYLLAAAPLAEYLRKMGVGHLHVHFAFGASGVAIFLHALAGIPYSLSIHGSDVLLPQHLQEEKLARAKFVISNCRYHVSNLRRKYPSLEKQKFHLVRLGVDLDSGFWSNSTIPSTEMPLRILNVGRLHPVKAQDRLIRACGRLAEMGVDFRCKIAGGGSCRQDLEDLIARLGLKDRVELLGPRFEHEVAELFDWAHVMVLSSLSEGTPVTVIEAMAKARPVVAPRITALPELVEDGETGFLFRQDSVEDLALALRRFAQNPELIREMGVRARQRCGSFFNIRCNAQGLVEIFQKETGSWKNR